MLLNVNDDHVDGDETDNQKEEKPNDLPRPTHVANVEISPTVQTCFRTKFEEDPFLNHFDCYLSSSDFEQKSSIMKAIFLLYLITYSVRL